MLRVYYLNWLDVFEVLMEFIVECQWLDDFFQVEMVLVQSIGMVQWLQMILVVCFGIVVNIEFLLLVSFIWDMFVCVLKDILGESVFSKQSMSWKLMIFLLQYLEEDDFILLCQYLSDDGDKCKLFQLVVWVVDFYDQYFVYCLEWLMCWEVGQWVEGFGDVQQWQVLLWQVLVSYIVELGQLQWYCVNFYQCFISILEKVDELFVGLLLCVFICGIFVLLLVYFQVLQVLGKYVDVYVLFINFCCYYWGDIKDLVFLVKLLLCQWCYYCEVCVLFLFCDIEQVLGLFNDVGEQDVGNLLFVFWGKLGCDYIYLLVGLECYEELDVFVDIVFDNLLYNLQLDIFELCNVVVVGQSVEVFVYSCDKCLLMLDDCSLSIYVCYSLQCEVEVLYDRLLVMLEVDLMFMLWDIIVMVVDIDSYSFYIQVVFGVVSGDCWLLWVIFDCCV